MPKPILVSDCLVEVKFGTSDQLGATPTTWSTPAVVIQCQAKSVRASIQSVTQDISTLCSDTVELLGVKKQGTLELELWIDAALGPIFRDKINWLAQVKVTLTSTAGSILFYQGLVSDSSITLTPGDVEMETATIQLGAWGLTSVTTTT
jgi:hypothetical protein